MRLKRILPLIFLLFVIYLARGYMDANSGNEGAGSSIATLAPVSERAQDRETLSSGEPQALDDTAPDDASPNEAKSGEAATGEAKGEAVVREQKLYWGNMSTLDDHFQRHGGDFDAKSREEYALLAHEFYENRDDYQVKIDRDGNGDVRVYDDATKTFGAYNRNGTTKTFYKASGGQAYFDRQPGEVD